MHRNTADMALPISIYGSIEQIIKKIIRIRNKSVGSRFIVHVYVHAFIHFETKLANYLLILCVRNENL